MLGAQVFPVKSVTASVRASVTLAGRMDRSAKSELAVLGPGALHALEVTPSPGTRPALQELVWLRSPRTPLEASLLEHLCGQRSVVELLALHDSQLVQSNVLKVTCVHRLHIVALFVLTAAH